jgi:uncharacterized protein (DUF1800 family)
MWAESRTQPSLAVTNATKAALRCPSVSGRTAMDPDWAWAAYEPDSARPWDLRRVGHLCRRAGFGADWGQLQQALADGPQRAVEKLVRPPEVTDLKSASRAPGGASATAFNQTYDEYEASATDSGSADTLRAWWLRRMIHTPQPLLEKMTLFWHDHFAASNVKVKSALLMHRHVQLLRSHALGRFEPLLAAVTEDPAMLLSLGCQANRKAQPNENYARQLMECFSLGLGHYREEDVREAARAFTGWFVLRGQLRYIPREHDSGVKKILGREGDFDGKDVVEIVLSQSATPRLLVRKIYRWLISETDPPSDALIAPLVDRFADGYNISDLVERMLRSNLFFSPAAYRRRIKGPVEFALGIIRGLEGAVSTTQLGQDLADLGQSLYHPPTAGGWPGGRHWINRFTLLGRSNLALALVAGSEPYGDQLNPLATAGKHGRAAPESAVGFLVDLFLQGDVEPSVRQALMKSAGLGSSRSRLGMPAGGDPSTRFRRLTHAVLTLPEFQLA